MFLRIKFKALTKIRSLRALCLRTAVGDYLPLNLYKRVEVLYCFDNIGKNDKPVHSKKDF